jgi:transposase
MGRRTFFNVSHITVLAVAETQLGRPVGIHSYPLVTVGYYGYLGEPIGILDKKLISSLGRLKKKLDPDKFYPLSEAAQWLGVTITTVKEYLHTGRLTGSEHPENHGKPLVLARSFLALAEERKNLKKNQAKRTKRKRSGIPPGCGELISVVEAAALLQASSYTVKDWLRKGILKGVRQGVKNTWMACSNSVNKKRSDMNLL